MSNYFEKGKDHHLGVMRSLKIMGEFYVPSKRMTHYSMSAISDPRSCHYEPSVKPDDMLEANPDAETN